MRNFGESSPYFQAPRIKIIPGDEVRGVYVQGVYVQGPMLWDEKKREEIPKAMDEVYNSIMKPMNATLLN